MSTDVPMKNRVVILHVEGDEQASGILSIPDRSTSAGSILIAHGAGNDMNEPVIVFLAHYLAQRGFVTLRFNFPYSEKGRKTVDSLKVLSATFDAAYEFLGSLSECRTGRIYAAGKSLGGRVAASMVAEGRLLVDRLIFLGYPLHAPGRKEQLKDAVLFEILIPMLFFAGAKDPFCDLVLLKEVLPRLPASWDLDIIPDGDHSFKVPVSSGVSQIGVYERISRKTYDWLNA